MENNTEVSTGIKIIDFSPYYVPHIGGLEKYAEELHGNLAKRGCQITVFTPRIPKSAKEEESGTNIRIIRYPAFDIIFNYPLPSLWKKEFWNQWGKINPALSPQCIKPYGNDLYSTHPHSKTTGYSGRRGINTDEFDVAISTVRFFVQPLMALFFAKKHKIPLLHIEHCSDYVKNRFVVSFIARIVDMTIGRFSLSHADKIITPSQSAARFVRVLSGKEASVIYRGMPFSEIDAILPQDTLRQQIGNKKIITSVGRLIYGKGIIHLLEAIHLLKRDDIFLLIVGDGPEKGILQEYVKKNELSEQVKFLGNIPFDEVIGILKITDIFINPSYNEGLPTSVLEAGVCRRAIIATDVGGTLEIITPDRSGIIIKPCNTREVKNALEKLLDDAPLRESLGENARREIEQKFNWEGTISAYLKEIGSLQKKL